MNAPQRKLETIVNERLQNVEQLRTDLDREINELRSIGFNCDDSLAMRVAADAAKHAMSSVYFAMQNFRNAASEQLMNLADTTESN